VAVLFADIAGSTPMVADQDPESALSLLRPTLDAMAACIRRYGGTVNRVTGDGIMALFGAPAAMEDHALAACCAALAMQEDKSRPALRLPIRIGVHVGEVVVHALQADGAAGLDAAGEVVHLAARLQQEADPGTILVSAAVLRAAGPRVTAEPKGSLALRGLARPTDVFTLVAAAPELTRLEAAGAALLSPFIGRDDELSLLEAARNAVQQGQGRAIALVGEAGIGKSRLMREFGARHGSEMALVQGQCLRWRDKIAFHPLKPLLRRRMLLDTETPLETQRALLDSAVAAWPAPGNDATALAALLDLPTDAPWRAQEPQARRRRMVAACSAALRQLVHRTPVLLMIDDMHWADTETQNALEALAADLTDTRMLLVLGWRPEFTAPLSSHRSVQRLSIGALPVSQAQAMSAQLLGEQSGDPGLAERLATRCGGNPLFIEAQAAAHREGAADGDLPQDVRALLGARIDRADTDGKRLLEAMAVHGEPAPIGMLAEIAELPPLAANDAAGVLASRGLAVAQGVGAAALLSCSHALVQDVAYADMLRSRRRVLHARIGETLERMAGDRVEEFSETLARHARRAEDWARLVRHARTAGRRAAARNANREAVRFLDDAADALDRLPEAEPALAVDVRFDLRQPLFRLGRMDELRTRLSEAAHPAGQSVRVPEPRGLALRAL